MLFALLDPRVWIAALLGVVLSFGSGYLKGHHDGKKGEQDDQAIRTAHANLDTFKRTEHLQRNVDEASSLAAENAMRDRRLLAAADSAVDRLRLTIDAVERAAAASGDASAKYTAALGADLRSCSQEYRSVGEDAAGYARDSLMYQRAWPK